jgi:hypothetical protein
VAESDDADADRAVCPGQNASAGRAAAVSKTSSSLTERDELNRPPNVPQTPCGERQL